MTTKQLNKRVNKIKAMIDNEKVFEKRKNALNEQNSTELIPYKEPGFLKKFFNLIKGIFNKNKF